MDYNLRPQWQYWNFNTSQRHLCGKCGLYHRQGTCYAFKKMCYQCGRKGHYARMCFTQFQAARPTGSKQVTYHKRKSNRKQERDHERMDKFKQKRKVLQEMPFSSIRNGAFINSIDTTQCLKTELQKMKEKLNQEKTKSDKEIKELKEKLICKEEETFQYKEVTKTFQEQVEICESINRQLRQKIREESNNL